MSVGRHLFLCGKGTVKLCSTGVLGGPINVWLIGALIENARGTQVKDDERKVGTGQAEIAQDCWAK